MKDVLRGIAKLSEHIDGLATAKRTAEQQLDFAVDTLGIVHEQLVKAAEHVAQLTEGSKTGALVDLAEYTQIARAIVAEAMLALSGLRPNLNATQNRPTIIADARVGMQAKLLAKWEAEALREAVVDALSGETDSTGRDAP